MKTIKTWLLGIWQDHRNYLAVATLAATGCEITFTLHRSNCKKPPESSHTLLLILIWQSTLISPVPIFLETMMTRSQAAAPLAHVVGTQQKMDADLLPRSPSCHAPAQSPPSSKSPEALVLIMKCSAKSNVNKWHAQLTWQQSSPARNAAALNSAGLGTNLQKKDQSMQEAAKVKDRIFSAFLRCLEKYTAQHPGVCWKNGQTISWKRFSNFQAVLGGTRRTSDHHTYRSQSPSQRSSAF